MNFIAIQVYVVPLTAPVADVLGGPLPANVEAEAVLKAQFPRGYQAAGGGAVNPPAPPPPVNNNGGGGGGNAGAGAITITAFPPAGGITGISGIVTGLGAGSYNAVMYLEGTAGSGFWTKPYPGTSVPVNADWSFAFPIWASNPAYDKAFISIRIFIIPSGTAVVTALGGGLPAAITGAAVAAGSYPNGYKPPGGNVQPPPPAQGAAVLTLTKFPAAGAAAGAVAGTLAGVDIPANWKVVMYVIAPSGAAYIKPFPGESAKVAADGTWAFANFASDPNDARFASIELYAINAAQGVINVLGGALPDYGAVAAVAANYPAGYTPPGGGGGAAGGGGGGVQQPAGVTPTIQVTAFPAAGKLTAITGIVTGLPNPLQWRVVLYVLGE